MTYGKVIVLLFAVAVLVSSVEAAPLQKLTVINAASRRTVCNDGTPAIYYFRKGFGAGSKTWIIFLEGGGFCDSVNDCNQRKVKSPDLMTSNGTPETLNEDGILSGSAAENPDFYNANHVVVSYCSSDLWSGNRKKSQQTGGHEFRGFKIVRAVINDLLKKPGRNLSSANRVLLSGTSAGGVGVMVHLDWLSRKLPSADVRGINDGGWTPDLTSLPSSYNPRRGKKALRLWNGKVDRSCATANEDFEYDCYTSAVYPHLSIPLFVQMSQYDKVYLSSMGVEQPFNGTELLLANLFASKVRESLTSVNAAFSPRTNTHALIHTDKFTELTVDGYTLSQILGNFFFDRPGQLKAIED